MNKQTAKKILKEKTAVDRGPGSIAAAPYAKPNACKSSLRRLRLIEAEPGDERNKIIDAYIQA